MASILPFKSSGSPSSATGPFAGGSLVAMRHIDLDTVVEIVRVLRQFGKLSLLDDFNGRRHAAGLEAKPETLSRASPARTP